MGEVRRLIGLRYPPLVTMSNGSRRVGGRRLLPPAAAAGHFASFDYRKCAAV